MNPRLLFIALSVAAVTSVGILGLSSMTNAASHENMTMTDTNSSNMTDNENATTTSQEEEEHNETSTIVRDSLFVDLTGKVLPANDFLHLYDTTPYMIMNGHVATKLPCNEQSVSPVQILIGQAPNMTSAEFETIPELSNPGGLCMYHVDLHSAHGNHTGTAEGQFITDVALMNPTNSPVTFPNTSTIVIGVNEIMPLPEEAHEHEGSEGHTE